MGEPEIYGAVSNSFSYCQRHAHSPESPVDGDLGRTPTLAQIGSHTAKRDVVVVVSTATNLKRDFKTSDISPGHDAGRESWEVVFLVKVALIVPNGHRHPPYSNENRDRCTLRSHGRLSGMQLFTDIHSALQVPVPKPWPWALLRHLLLSSVLDAMWSAEITL